jgi:hypothetical protein
VEETEGKRQRGKDRGEKNKRNGKKETEGNGQRATDKEEKTEGQS